MIAHLRGDVIKIAENEIILDVNGVGYEVICSKKIVDYANREPHNLSIFTELVVRDMAWTLYGFFCEQEKIMFDALTSVQGVGGRIAIALLSEFTEDELYHILLNEDKRMLCKANGIGERLASRIISELKHKIAKMDLKKVSASVKSTLVRKEIDDVKSALSNLGYANTDISLALSDPAFSEINEFDQILKLALKKLSGAHK